MIYKNSKEYKTTVKNLNDALYEGAQRAKQEKQNSQPNKPSKSLDKPESE